MNVNTLDRYEILGELGRGAISIVYDARDLLTDDRVALKLIEPSLWAPISAAEPLRFLTEAMPEWRLRHPNIVRVYDAGDSDGSLYIAMERLEGRTLRRVLDESPLPGLPRSLRMATELASGLAYAHERGVVHRYLNPSNIFVFADDRAKITDFGMAPLRDAALASPNHAACLSYMSPEAIRCDATIDGRSDIFSLGVVLYEMLTGERPFSGDSPDEIMRNVLEAEPPLPSEVNACVAPMVDLLVWNMLAKRRFDRGPSAEILARCLRRLGEEVDGVLTAHARDEGVSAAAGTTDERASDDRNVVLMPGHRGEDRAPSAEILVHPLGELGEEVDGVLTAHARDEGVSAAAGTTDERASDDRNVVLMPGHRGDDRAPSAEILVHPLGELGEEVDGVLTAHARDEGVSAAAGTTDERASDDRNVVLMPGHRGDDRAPSAEILVHPLGELGEEVDGVLTAHARDEGVSAAAGTTDERASDDRNVVLMPGHRGEDRAPSAEILVHPLGELGEEVDGVLTAHARDEGVSAAAGTTDERASDDRNVVLMPGHRGDDRAPSAEILVHPLGELGEEVDGVLTAHARDEGVSAAAGTTDERASDDRNVVLMPGHRGDDRAPSAEILVHPLGELGEEVDGVLTAHARDEGVSAAAGTTDERASDDRNVVLMPGHRGAPQRAKLRLPTYALTVLILAVAGSGFLWQWRQSLGSSEADSATPSEEPATAITFEPSIPDEPRLSASAPEPKEAASEPEPKKRASKAPARKPSRSAVASGSATEQEIEPPAVALATEPASAPLPPPAKIATLVFDVSPWGEIYVDGKLHGTTPPVKTVDLPPGRHRIELRNSAQPPHLIYTTLEPDDVRRIRHQFE